MFRFVILSSFVFCTATAVTMCPVGTGFPQTIDGNCPDPDFPVLSTDTNGDPVCCTTADAYEGTTAASATTASSGCVDKLNPRTGVSDCPARANLCTDSNYIELMKVQCPKTCNYCSSSGTTGSTGSSGSCVDLPNPRTGVSDCPSLANLCNDSNYVTLMTTQCPKTCGRCSSSSGTTAAGTATTTARTGTCIDQVNLATGVSDCPRRRSLCTNSAYQDLMRSQCPVTCGFC